MSFAPRDTHEAQVQFALERGVPAMIGVMATRRLPYPARAFDMAHCSRCLIPWFDYGKLGWLFPIYKDPVLIFCTDSSSSVTYSSYLPSVLKNLLDGNQIEHIALILNV